MDYDVNQEEEKQALEHKAEEQQLPGDESMAKGNKTKRPRLTAKLFQKR